MVGVVGVVGVVATQTGCVDFLLSFLLSIKKSELVESCRTLYRQPSLVPPPFPTRGILLVAKLALAALLELVKGLVLPVQD